MIDLNGKDADSLLLEVLSKSPHITGITNKFDQIEAPIPGEYAKRNVCEVHEIASPIIKKIKMDGTSATIEVMIDVLVRIGQDKIELYINNYLPLLSSGSEKLSLELTNMFSYLEFDISKMISINDAIYIARPINGKEFITWAQQDFFLHDEARRLSMLIISALIESDPLTPVP